ncbi:MAG: caspase family protein [Rhizobiaceae bacterium]
MPLPFRIARHLVLVAILMLATLAQAPLANAGIEPGGNRAWLVVASRTRADEAISMAQGYARQFPAAIVFQSSNGFFGVSLGWADRTQGEPMLRSLVSSGTVPADSYFHNGERFVRAIWSAGNVQTLSVGALIAATQLQGNGRSVEQQTPIAPPVISSGSPQQIARGGIVSGLASSGDNFLSLRTGPGTSFREIARMREYTRLTVNVSRGDWYQVSLENGMRGWAFGKYVALGGTASPPQPSNQASNVPEIGPEPKSPQTGSDGQSQPGSQTASAPKPDKPAISRSEPSNRIADEKRVALVIGNSHYQNTTELPNPANDASVMSTKLTELGFQVISGVDAGKADMERAIREFVKALQDSDVALFFYAGHGMQVNGNNYIIPIDAKLEDSTALDFETIDLSTVLSFMNQKGRLAIALLDACRDNPLSRKFTRSLGATRSAFIGRGLAAPNAGSGEILIGFATAPGEVALDGDGTNSPFTSALIKHIGTPGLEIELMLKRVKDEVYRSTGEAQEPWHNSALRREFYFNQQ